MDLRDQITKFIGPHHLSLLRTREAGDAFIHEGPAKVVGPRPEAELGHRPPHLDPGNLNVGNEIVEQDPSQGVDTDTFLRCWAGPGKPLLIESSIGMNKTQGDKLGETTSLLLDLPEQKDVSHPVAPCFSMAVHHS